MFYGILLTTVVYVEIVFLFKFRLFIEIWEEKDSGREERKKIRRLDFRI
jgi:hypothetical protein